MTIQLTTPQALLTLESLQHQLSNAEGLHKRLSRFNPDSTRLVPIAIEITNLRLAILAVEMAMGK